ncbi:MAG: hypothetical protein ACJ790_04355 [Myxococcaceae bacterium]
MKTTLTLTAALLFVLGCGGSTGPKDAGVDETCGIDCDSQRDYGLIAQTCFEFSSTDTSESPPALGLLVSPVTTLEGNVKVMQVSYLQGGLKKMTDSYTIKGTDLYLIRREWQAGQSVSYKDDSGALVGVLLARRSTGAGETLSSSVKADVVNSGNRDSVATTYTVTTAVPSSTDLKTPAETYTDGLTLLQSETPDHGRDPRRLLVHQKGFVLFSSPLSISGGTAQAYKLQNIKQLPEGSFDCGN